MKQLLTTLVILSLCSATYAQEFKFKKVSKEELSETYHPLDSTAVAATLWEKANLRMRYDDGFVYDTEVTKRIKIYDNDGFEYATITIPFYQGDSNAAKEKITGLKAYVYNLEGDKIVDEKLSNKDFIEEETSEYWSQIKFTFPNVKPGTIIEYTYNKTSPHFTELPRWNFQDEIPVNLSEYRLAIPKMLSYKEQQRGFHYVERTVERGSTNFRYISSNTAERSDYGSGKTDAIFYNYVARDVPKLKDEPFVNNIQNFMTSIVHELSYIKIGDGPVEQYSTTWPEIAESLQESDGFGEQMDNTKYFEEDLQPIIESSENEQALISNIFNFVKNSVKWNDNRGIYTSDKLKRVYEDKTGNIADINLMLTSMLRYAGLDANPVLISTIDHGIPTNFVSRKNYNYVISAVKYNGEHLLLDASSPYSAPNILPIRCINWFGQLVRPDASSEQISLQPKEKSRDNFLLSLKLNVDGSVEGKMRRQYTNHLGYLYRSKYNEDSKEEYITKKGNEFGIDILEYSNKNVDKLSEAVAETISFKKDDAADVINDNIYFTPLMFLAQDKNPFNQDQKERKLPIDFMFPVSNKYIINIDLPEGYAVDYLPEPAAVALPENIAIFKYNIQQAVNGQIQIRVSEDINTPILPADYYLSLKNYFNEIVKKETDKIVLTKV